MTVLVCDHAVVHPDCELTPIADDELGGDAERVVDECGRTGRTRAVVSSAAVADTDVLHDSRPWPIAMRRRPERIVPVIRKDEAMRHQRPVRGEAADYYFTYIDQVADGDIVGQLESQAAEAVAFFREIPESRTLHRYEPGKWSIREVLGHLNDCERLFTFRAFWFARGFDSPLPSFDQLTAASTALADRRAWPDLIEEFAAIRAATATLFGGLTETDWDRRGIASGNAFSVRSLAYIAVGHVTHHVAILRARYL
jgi:hypothetical protein